MGRGKDKVLYEIELTFLNGQVATVVIRDQDGQALVLGEAAVTACRRCGELSWIVRPMSSQSQDIPSVKKLSTNSHAEAVDSRLTPRV